MPLFIPKMFAHEPQRHAQPIGRNAMRGALHDMGVNLGETGLLQSFCRLRQRLRWHNVVFIAMDQHKPVILCKIHHLRRWPALPDVEHECIGTLPAMQGIRMTADQNIVAAAAIKAVIAAATMHRIIASEPSDGGGRLIATHIVAVV